MAKKVGTRNIKSYLAIHEMKRLGLNPLEEALKCINELDDIKKKSLESYDKMRGYNDKGDAGTSYLSTARSAVRDKADIYMNLCKFAFPTLTAVAIQDFAEESSEKTINTKEAIDIIRSDPFTRSTTEKVISAMTNVESLQSLPVGVKDDK